MIELKEDRERKRETKTGKGRRWGRANSYYSLPDLRHIWNKADRVGFAPS